MDFISKYRDLEKKIEKEFKNNALSKEIYDDFIELKHQFFQKLEKKPNKETKEELSHISDISKKNSISSENNSRLFKLLTDNSYDIISILAEDGTILFESKATERILGYDSDQRKGSNVFHFVHPEDRDFVMTEFNNRDVKQKIVEFRYRHQNGSWVWLEGSGQDFTDHPQIKGILVNSRDITRQKEARKALKESEKKYRKLIENLSEGIGNVDENERFIFANPAAEIIFGAGPGELEGRSLHDFLSTDQIQVITQETRLRKKGLKSVYEIELTRPDGKKIPILVSAVPDFDEYGKFTGTMGIFRDMTEIKKAGQALKESEEKFRLIFQNAGYGIATADPNGYITNVNPAFCELLGFSKEELTKMHFSDISLPEYHQYEFEQVERIMRNEINQYSFEKQYFTKQKKPVWVFLSVTANKDEKGNIIGFIGTIKDIEERRKAELELKKSEARYRSIFKNSAI